MDQFHHKLAVLGFKRLLTCNADQLVPFTWRKTEGIVRSEGFSIRYSAVALIGLKSAISSGLLENDKSQIHRRLKALKASLDQVNNFGDMGLVLFAAALMDDPRIDDLVEMSWSQVQGDVAKDNFNETMWMAWLLDGLCAATKLLPADKTLVGRITDIGNRLLSNQDPSSGLFYRTRKFSSFITRMRGRISFFSDQIYAIHALSSAYLTLGESSYLNGANQCAEKLTQTQGPLGEWWWVYNVRNGKVTEPFPIYSVHQHGMAPMALRRLKEAGGLDLEAACRKGISWLVQRHVQGEIVDDDASLIWRSIRRARLGRLITTCNQIAGLFGLFPNHSSKKRLQIDWECRPYELGWLLYAHSLTGA